ncbi:MAG: deoxyribonuclease IV [Promethearchaeota archaeon]
MKAGFHVSIAKSFALSVNRALDLTCDTFQIFSKSARTWKEREVPENEFLEFQQKVQESHISPIFAHSPYLPNYSSPDPELLEKSQKSLQNDLIKCEKLKIPYLVIHCGSHKNTSVQEGIERITNVLNNTFSQVSNDVKILLENEAGTKNSVGSTWEEIAKIIDGVEEENRLGICFDTCHAFVASKQYDLRDKKKVNRTLKNLEEFLEIDRLFLIHANDSKGDLGSHLDRHEHIGQGYIGLSGFKAIINHPILRDIPFIMETPRKTKEDDLRNIQTLRNLQEP